MLCAAINCEGPFCYSPCLWEGNGHFKLLQQTVPGERVSLCQAELVVERNP